MTKLGVGIVEVWGGVGFQSSVVRMTQPLKLNRVRQRDASSALVDPQMSRQVPSHQMSTLGPQLWDSQGVKQLCTGICH